jgi:sialic acid synthase SpsE
MIKLNKIKHCLVVAEVSANHCHDIDLAVRLIKAAPQGAVNYLKIIRTAL